MFSVYGGIPIHPGFEACSSRDFFPVLAILLDGYLGRLRGIIHIPWLFEEFFKIRFLLKFLNIYLTLSLNSFRKFVSNDAAGIENCGAWIKLNGFCNSSTFQADPER
jgi:hypothetical protein